MKILLSIKPQFAELIFEGKKKFEFRRTIFKNNNVTTVVVYASAPTQMVIGEFEIDHVISDDINGLWKKTKKFAGIEEEYFYEYFADKEQGYAIKIKSPKRYEYPLNLQKEFNCLPPQSFIYL